MKLIKSHSRKGDIAELKAVTFLLEKGYEVEVDVWYENNNFYLGHDEPILRIDTNLFKNNKKTNF